MIDFSKITKTTKGLDCRYLGPREYRGKILHRFAIFNDQGEVFCFYDDKGTKLDFDGANWIASDYCNSHQIIAPPKIVEVTQYVGLLANSHGDYYILASKEKEQLAPYGCLSIEQKTFRFEVPNE